VVRIFAEISVLIRRGILTKDTSDEISDLLIAGEKKKAAGIIRDIQQYYPRDKSLSRLLERLEEKTNVQGNKENASELMES